MIRIHPRPWIFCLVLALAGITIPACRVTDLELWSPVAPPPDSFEVKEVTNVAYYSGPDAAGRDHQLDLFLPKGLKHYPVVVLVHGGTWIMGDNRCCGLQSSVGKFLASQGIGAVLPNYRLSPKVKHPEHVKDVARAVAWTKAHIAEHGGDPGQLFLAGHSAGGHLVALLATDEQYLKAEGMRTEDVKGVIAISGVYRIGPGSVNVALGGASPQSLRADEMFPLRGNSRQEPASLGLPGIPVSINVFGLSFGDDPKVREAASPLNHVQAGLPPFLIFYAEKDLPTLPTLAEEFHRALVDKGCSSRLVKVLGRNHNSIVFQAIGADDPVARDMVHFIREHARPDHAESSPPGTR